MHLGVLVIILISVMLFYIAGRIIVTVLDVDLKSNPTYTVFVSTFIGLLTFVTLFAIYKSKFNTVFLGVVILAILYLCYIRYSTSKLHINLNFKELISNSNELKVFILLLIICTTYFLIQSTLFYNLPLNKFPPMDFLFYAGIVQNLDQFGVETTNNLIYPFSHSEIATPYHYADLWFATLYHSVFGIRSMESYVVISHAVLSGLLFIGMISVVKTITTNKFLIIISGFSIYATYFDLSNLLGGFASMTWATMSNPKFMFIGLVFVWFFINILDNTHSRSYVYILLLLPIFNILFAPMLYISLLLVLTIIYLRTKKRDNLFLLLVVFISALFIFVFYSINSSGSSLGLDPLKLLKSNLHISFIYKLKNIMRDILLSYSILWLPFIALIFLNYKKSLEIIYQNKILFLVIAFQVLIGAITWILLEDLYDSFQFFFLTLIGLSILSIVSVFLVFSKLESILFKRLLIVFTSVICMFFTYNMMQIPGFYIYTDNPNDSKYVEQVLNKIDETKNFNYIGVNIKSPEERLNSRNTYGRLTNYFISNYDGLYTVCLNPNFGFGKGTLSKTESNTHSYNPDPSPFLKYENQHITNCKGSSIDSLYLEYIKENNIEYIVLDRNVVLPSAFSTMVDTVFLDSKSGEKFVFLNNSKRP